MAKTTKTRNKTRKKTAGKNPAAVALGRLGGQAKKSKPFGFQTVGKSRLKKLSALGVAARVAARKTAAKRTRAVTQAIADLKHAS